MQSGSTTIFPSKSFDLRGEKARVWLLLTRHLEIYVVTLLTSCDSCKSATPVSWKPKKFSWSDDSVSHNVKVLSRFSNTHKKKRSRIKQNLPQIKYMSELRRRTRLFTNTQSCKFDQYCFGGWKTEPLQHCPYCLFAIVTSDSCKCSHLLVLAVIASSINHFTRRSLLFNRSSDLARPIYMFLLQKRNRTQLSASARSLAPQFIIWPGVKAWAKTHQRMGNTWFQSNALVQEFCVVCLLLDK